MTAGTEPSAPPAAKDGQSRDSAAPVEVGAAPQQRQPVVEGVSVYNPYSAGHLPPQSAPVVQAQPTPTQPVSGTPIQPLQITTNQQPVLSFTGTPPYPPPPVASMTSEEKWQRRIVEHNAYKASEEQQYEQTRSAPGKKGFFAQMENALQAFSHKANSVCSDVSFGTERSLRDSTVSDFVSRYERNFPQLAPQFPLLAGFECTFFSGRGEAVPGTVCITEKHFAFAPTSPMAQRPPVFDEFRNVVTYQIVQTLGEPSLLAFTGAGFVFHFAQFHKNLKQELVSLWSSPAGAAFHNFLTCFDHQWRQCATIPAPGYIYAPNPVYPTQGH